MPGEEGAVRKSVLQAMAVCPVEVSVAVLGGAWKMTIVKHLLEGSLRYSEIRRAVGVVTPRVLTRQLRELEQDGIVSRKAFPEVPPRVVYSLTPTGEALRDFVAELNRWGDDYISALQARAAANDGPATRSGNEFSTGKEDQP
ncbi:winged helix-turn-helix transcriptional regulator [Nocardia lasii]|uniref:Winged helix-turn-helix transcriptional regulator n=1 Tax=Nocardia lasii TaxID=1616107 RepID=A0ABW1JP62_9NOCA